MDSIYEVEYKGVESYFNTLSSLGYASKDKTFSILITIFLEECLSRYFYDYITDEDFTTIYKALECVAANNCIIDFPEYFNRDSIRHHLSVGRLRKSEHTNDLRMTEDNNMRVYTDKL